MRPFYNLQSYPSTNCVMTLVLGSQPRQGHGKVRAESVTQESHLHSQRM